MGLLSIVLCPHTVTAVEYRKEVPSAWLTRLSEAPRKPRVWKKNATWLGREQRAEIAKEWLPLDPPRVLPGAETSLSEAEMALGIVEIGWRLMLPRCLVVPPHVCGLQAHHVQEHAAVVDKHKEGEALVAQLTGYAERAMLLCMPTIINYAMGIGRCLSCRELGRCSSWTRSLWTRSLWAPTRPRLRRGVRSAAIRGARSRAPQILATAGPSPP